MIYSEYFAISPIDGRYKNKTKDLVKYFSEFAYMKYSISSSYQEPSHSFPIFQKI